jgi:hypothetical protein
MGACVSVLVALTLWALASADGQRGATRLTLQYERPSGFSRGSADRVQSWIANSLDGLIHIYPFQPFRGDFVDEFHRTLFRDWILAPYREDKRLGQPNFTTLSVKGAEVAISASFKNFNGGAHREHLRVAVLASGLVALVDISANSPDAFGRNAPIFSRLLHSLEVVEGDVVIRLIPPR